MEERFPDRLKLDYDFAGDPDRPYILDAPFGYFTRINCLEGTERLITAPKGYRTDFASIPRIFWRILPPHGRYAKAAVIHDWLCAEKPPTVDHKVAADIFGEAMAVLEVPRWKRSLMVWAVKWFGPKFKPEDA